MTRHTVGNPAEALFVQLTRRRVLERGLAVAAGAILELSALAAGSTSKVKGMAFDAFAVFDPRPVATLTEKLYPGSGVALTNLWRTRQFEYTWLRTISGRYSDFMRVTEEALVFATRTLKLDLPSDIRDELLQAYLGLEAWPDAAPVLQKLKAASVRLVILSNFTPAMLSGGIQGSGPRRRVRACAEYRSRQDLQTRSPRLPAWDRRFGIASGANCVRGVRGLGCRWSQDVRVPDLLGEPAGSTARGAWHLAGWHGCQSNGPGGVGRLG
jgi:2-haloalkanoic acid dehalogenase type II